LPCTFTSGFFRLQQRNLEFRQTLLVLPKDTGMSRFSKLKNCPRSSFFVVPPSPSYSPYPPSPLFPTSFPRFGRRFLGTPLPPPFPLCCLPLSSFRRIPLDKRRPSLSSSCLILFLQRFSLPPLAIWSKFLSHSSFFPPMSAPTLQLHILSRVGMIRTNVIVIFTRPFPLFLSLGRSSFDLHSPFL